jgi:DNA-binding beta-propeller fold protein YncE
MTRWFTLLTLLAAGQPRTEPGVPLSVARLREPTSIAVDSAGQRYVVESQADRVAILDHEGVVLRTFGRTGVGPGEFNRPHGIALTPAGQIVVSDTGNRRVQLFRSDGSFVLQFGARGLEPGQFLEPLGVAADANRIVVADGLAARVQVFDQTGRFLFYIWNRGTHAQELARPVDVELTADGRILVSDQVQHRVHVYDANGTWVASWGGYGSISGFLASPAGLTVHNDTVWIADAGNRRITQLDLSGRPYATVPTGGFRVTDLAFSPAKQQFVVCVALHDWCEPLSESSRVPSPTSTASVGSVGSVGAIDPAGWLISDATETSLLWHARSQPDAVQLEIGRPGSHFTELGWIRGAIADARAQTVLVSDSGNQRLQLLTLSPYSRLLRAISFDADALSVYPGSQLIEPGAIPGPMTRGPNDSTLLLDVLHGRVLSLDRDWKRLAEWPANSKLRFDRPVEIAAEARSGRVAVVDRGARRVLVFASDGRQVFELGPFDDPAAVAFTSRGQIAVADRAAAKIMLFDRGGENGIELSTEVPLRKPAQLLSDGDRLLVLDPALGRVVRIPIPDPAR